MIKQLYVITASGVESTVYSEYSLIDEVLKTHQPSKENVKIKRVIETNFIIDPLHMIAIRDWLNDRIDEYQNVFGEIPTIDEDNKRLLSLPQKTTNNEK